MYFKCAYQINNLIPASLIFNIWSPMNQLKETNYRYTFKYMYHDWVQLNSYTCIMICICMYIHACTCTKNLGRVDVHKYGHTTTSQWSSIYTCTEWHMINQNHSHNWSTCTCTPAHTVSKGHWVHANQNALMYMYMYYK